MADEPKRTELGDLLAPTPEGAALRAEADASRKERDRMGSAGMTETDAERLIVGATVRLGQNPRAALDDFQRGGPLSELIRAFLGVRTAETDSFWQAIDVLDALRTGGLKGEELRHRAAAILSAPDALGQSRRNVDAGSLKTYEAEAKKLRKHARLTALFAPDGWRPSRNSLKEKPFKR